MNTPLNSGRNFELKRFILNVEKKAERIGGEGSTWRAEKLGLYLLNRLHHWILEEILN